MKNGADVTNVCGYAWFQCGSGSSFLSQCGPESGSRKPNKMRIQADPDPDHIFELQKVEFLTWKIYLKLVKVKNIGTYEGTKAVLKGRIPGLFVNCGQFPCSWIRIRILNTDPDSDPRQPNECGTMWIRIRIHNTGCTGNCFIFRNLSGESVDSLPYLEEIDSLSLGNLFDRFITWKTVDSNSYLHFPEYGSCSVERSQKVEKI